jgi:uncharacterized protein YkwD
MGAHRLAALGAAVQLVLLWLCGSASASADCPNDRLQPSAASADAAAAALACELNAVRADSGLRSLRWNGRLAAAAQSLADDMAARHYASHVTPEGVGVAGRVRETGYFSAATRWSVAENLAWATNELSTPLSTASGWMASAGHRNNILDAGLDDVGIGVAQGAVEAGGQKGTIYVADFGSREAAAVTVHKRGRHTRRTRRR